MDVTAITRRRHPILTSIVSQVTPSESSTIRRAAMEPELLHHLRTQLGIGGIRNVSMHEPLTAVLAVFVIQFKHGAAQTEVWRGLRGGRQPISLRRPLGGRGRRGHRSRELRRGVLGDGLSARNLQHDLEVVKHIGPRTRTARLA